MSDEPTMVQDAIKIHAEIKAFVEDQLDPEYVITSIQGQTITRYAPSSEPQLLFEVVTTDVFGSNRITHHIEYANGKLELLGRSASRWNASRQR